MSADGSGEAGDWISATKRSRLACSVPSPPANLEETPAKPSDNMFSEDAVGSEVAC